MKEVTTGYERAINCFSRESALRRVGDERRDWQTQIRDRREEKDRPIVSIILGFLILFLSIGNTNSGKPDPKKLVANADGTRD